QHRLIESERLQAIGAMASGMSHYMKNVLQSLLGRISLIARRVDDPEIGRSLGAAQMTVMDAVGTLRNLDAFAEPASLSETQPLDVNRVVREAIGGARGTWRAEARA